MAAARQGDRSALDALLRRHYDRIHAVCRRLLGNEADALDAAQDACIAIARGIGRFDGRAAFSTWAYRVTTNACLDELRRRRRRPEPTEAPSADLVADPSPDVATTLGERSEVDAALAQLAPELRAAVVLRDLCDLDYAAIAEALHIPPGTVRSRIARGRARLADLLAPTGDAGPPPQPLLTDGAGPAAAPVGEPEPAAPPSNEVP